jgi:hypothetical protein
MVELHPSRRRVVAALRDPFLSRTTPPGWKRTVSARPHGFRDIPVHVHKNGTAWAGMPGKRQLEDGHLKLDPNGKALYPAAVAPGPLVGVRTGEASGLSVLDIDSAKHREAENWLAAARLAVLNRLGRRRGP